jgi:hypothetical protein
MSLVRLKQGTFSSIEFPQFTADTMSLYIAYAFDKASFYKTKKVNDVLVGLSPQLSS